MPRPKQKIRSPILLTLMLIAGPLNAHVVFTCSMMQGALHDQCCCEERRGCADRGSSVNLTTDRNPCCERSVELSVDHDALETLTPIEVRSDVDPPPLLALSDVVTPVVTAATVVCASRRRASHEHGSNTYRITERLRL